VIPVTKATGARGGTPGAVPAGKCPLLVHVGVDHHGDELGERHPGLPAELGAGLRGVPDQQVDLGRPEESRVDDHQLGPVLDADPGEGDVQELADGVRLAGGHHVVVAGRRLQHPPHRLYVVAGEPPVPLGVQVAQPQFLGQPELDPGHPIRHLAGDELPAPPRRLMVEQDPRGGVHAVRLAVVDRHVVAVDLGHAVRRSRPQQGGLGLRHLLHLAEHLRRRGLVEAHPAQVVAAVQPGRLEHVQHAEAGDLAGQPGVLPRVGDEGNGAQVVDLVRGGRVHRPHQAGQVGQIARDHPDVGYLTLDQLPLGIVLAADEAEHLVPLAEQQLRQIEAVLTGHSGDERAWHGKRFSHPGVDRAT
jgi:hypothetical protein